jgi:putative peptidoglycan lipid II flippase
VLLGRGVVQLSGLLDTFLVSFLGSGANAAFAYAQTIFLLPMSVLGTGEAAVQLPDVSAATAERELDVRNQAIATRLGASLARLLMLAIPCAAALVVLPHDIVGILFRSGRFDAEASASVARLVRMYGVAICANATGRVFAATLFALGLAKAPARFALARVALSAALALALMRPFGVLGVVLGATAAAWLEAALLGWILRKQIGRLGFASVPFVKIATVTLGCVLASLRAAPLTANLPNGLLRSAIAPTVFGLFFVGLAPTVGLVSLGRLLRRR